MWHQHSHGLTGNVRFRVGWFGRVIVEVEELFKSYEGWDYNKKYPSPSVSLKWRKARIEDFSIKSIEALKIL